MPPVVSVIMPAFNAERFIDRAIESALNQSLTDLEVVVVDDASTDGTVGVVRAFDDPRIRLYESTTNGGPSVARNRALAEASGEHIAVLDADDWFRPWRLERMLKGMDAHDADIVADDIYCVNEGATFDLDSGTVRDHRGFPQPLQRLFRSTDLPHVLTASELVRGRLPGGNDPRIGLVKPLFKTDFLRSTGVRYDPEALYSQDFAFYLECLGAGATFVLIDVVGYCYRGHSGMRSNDDELIAQQNRLEITQKLLQRSYVSTNDDLRQALLERRATFEAECQFYRFQKQLEEESALQAVASAPLDGLTYALRMLRQRSNRFTGRLGRIPVRLKQMIGWYPTWNDLHPSGQS